MLLVTTALLFDLPMCFLSNALAPKNTTS
jgi:hypothetical protein